MKKHIFIITTLGIFSLQSLSAQSTDDAYRLSTQTPTSTALSIGMGGVGGSMGGDFNSLSINPAGIGVYRAGELSITPSIRINQNTSNFDGSKVSYGSSDINFDNIGLVFQTSPRNGKWRSVAFGIGMNTLSNYNYSERIYGNNNQSSISDMMSASAFSNGVTENTVPPYGFLGYQGYLLDEDYNPIVPLSQGLIQDKITQHKGSLKEYNFTLGGNYDEKILLGMSMGITTHNYKRNTNFFEEDASNNTDNNFDYASLTETINTSGVGVNFKMGAIYVPNKNSRIGISLHTPTWVTLTDISDYYLETNTEYFKEDMGYSDKNPKSIAQPSAPYQFNYGMRTPWKAVISGTVYGNMGMLSADYEITDFASMRYAMPDDLSYEQYINTAIQNKYGFASTLRLGGELVLDKLFLRAGTAYQTSPYQNMSNKGSRLDLSAGVGVRLKSLFLDLGYMNRQTYGTTSLYDVQAESVYNPNISSNLMSHFVSFTLGFKFR